MSKQTIFGRVSQLVRANINDILSRAEDPEKMLDQLVLDYGNAIHDAREAVAQSVGNLRIKEDDYREAQEAATEWGRKASAASRKAEAAETSDTAEQYNNLARQALTKQLDFEKQSETLKASIDADTAVVDQLKDNLGKMERKLDELRSKRTELISRAKMAQAQEQVQGALASVNAADPTSDLARFEDRIRQQEALVRGRTELASESLDEQFASLDADGVQDEVEARLAALKGKEPVAV